MSLTPKDVATSRSLIEAVTAKTGFANLVGVEVVGIAPGEVTMSLPQRPDLTQMDGYFHGGVISGLADHAAGAAVVSALPNGRFCLTVNLMMSFLSPAKGDRLIANAAAVRVSSSIGTATVEIRCVAADGKEALCAIATATMRSIAMTDAGQV